jgi:hypothetical protein
MRARLTLIMTLVLGVFLTVGGAALAVTGMSSQHNAKVAQYGDDDGDDDDDDDDEDEERSSQGVLNTQVTPPSPPGVAPGESGTLPTTAEQGVARARQEAVGAGGRELPFTGYAAVPILLLGVALLAGSLLIARRLKRTGTQPE